MFKSIGGYFGSSAAGGGSSGSSSDNSLVGQVIEVGNQKLRIKRLIAEGMKLY